MFRMHSALFFLSNYGHFFEKWQFSKPFFSCFLLTMKDILSFSWLIQTLLTRICCQNVVILSFYAKKCLPKWAGEKSLSSVLLIALEFRIDETIRIVLLISNLCSFCTRNARFSQKIEISKSKFFIWLSMKKIQ